MQDWNESGSDNYFPQENVEISKWQIFKYIFLFIFYFYFYINL